METNARDVLDYALFHNVYNMPERKGFEITFEGDNYVVWDQYNDQLYHFRVVIEEHEWDSTQARADQEWDI